ncbi:unnamed protein product [Leptidea sinapis]|uniref:Uncharacterized protein n=1 Tax=Leptidea sinapis TaxID=189913 RepID=A0A5E4R2H7_9NEOP|nr:unnamed protein product [Leptidea sinapis]
MFFNLETLLNYCLQVPKTSSLTMQTRKATMKEMENKLSCAAKELKKSKDLCQTLLNEREECELEIQKSYVLSDEILTRRARFSLHDLFSMVDECGLQVCHLIMIKLTD